MKSDDKLNQDDLSKITALQNRVAFIQFSLNPDPDPQKDPLHKRIGIIATNILDAFSYDHPKNNADSFEALDTKIKEFNSVAADILKAEWETIKKEVAK